MNKIILLVVLSLAASSVFAQAENAKSSKISIEEIISNYSTTSGEQVLVDPRVKGRISLYGQSLQELSYDNLTTILRIHGFASFRSGGYLVIIPLNVTKQQSIGLVNSDQQYELNQVVTDLIELDKLCPYDLVPLLRPLVPPTSHFAPMRDPRVILMTDTYGNTLRIRAIVERLEAQLNKKQSCGEPKRQK